jgi:hypothetical protein
VQIEIEHYAHDTDINALAHAINRECHSMKRLPFKM